MSKKEKLLHEQQEKNAELQKRKIIEVQDVSMRFRLTDDKIMSLKEFVTRKLSGKYKTSEFWALKDVSFDVYRGEVVGIIGHNGAGKSTILKVISGILKPTEGSVICGGNIVPMLELGSGFDHDLTGRENIFLNGAILGYTEDFLKSKYDEIVAFSELGEFIDVPIRNYSSGMLMRLAFSIATVVNPQILIVDEILAVGDANFQEKSRKRMLELMSGGGRQIDLGAIIERYDRRIAMSVLADFIMLGSNSAGSYALSSDKTELFSLALGTYLDIICDAFNTQAIPRLFDMNRRAFAGLKELPKMVHGDVEKPDLDKLGSFIERMTGAGLIKPNARTEKYVRRLAELPEDDMPAGDGEGR